MHPSEQGSGSGPLGPPGRKRKPERCSCGRKWYVTAPVKTVSGSVSNYWCLECDGVAEGIGTSPTTEEL